MSPQSRHGLIEVRRFDLDTETVSAAGSRGDVCGSGAHEGIEHGVADKAEHADEPVGQRNRIGSGMFPRRCAGDVGPDLAEQRPEASL